MDIAILIVLILIVLMFIKFTLGYMKKKVSGYKGIDPSEKVENSVQEDK